MGCLMSSPGYTSILTIVTAAGDEGAANIMQQHHAVMHQVHIPPLSSENSRQWHYSGSVGNRSKELQGIAWQGREKVTASALMDD